MTYLDIKFKGSMQYNMLINNNDIEQLVNHRRHTIIAVAYHILHKNEGQANFFSDELALLTKKIK